MGKASLPLRNEPALVSGAYAARLAKTAEQAAAADLLKALHAWMHGERPKIAVEDLPAGAVPVPAAPTLADTPRGLRGKDPRMQLNEMRQLGLIRGFSAELIEKRGPPHMPIFVMRGLVETVSGAVLHTEPVEARSKKEGELAVAGPLLALAIERSGEAAPDGRDMSIFYAGAGPRRRARAAAEGRRLPYSNPIAPADDVGSRRMLEGAKSKVDRLVGSLREGPAQARAFQQRVVESLREPWIHHQGQAVTLAAYLGARDGNGVANPGGDEQAVVDQLGRRFLAGGRVPGRRHPLQHQHVGREARLRRPPRWE